jgi:mRNA interferase HigB
MHVISLKTLRKAEENHADLVGPLGAWYKVARGAQSKNITDVRKTYPTTDPVGKYTVFNIKGNSYGLIVKIEYEYGLVFIRAIQTHAEYGKAGWNQ